MRESSTSRYFRIVRDPDGPPLAQAFLVVAVVTILITRLYLELADYPQVGGGNLHIAHALYGGALMMLTLLIGWSFHGVAVRVACVLLGGVGFGLFLDEVGKFVTRNNDYFYGPSAEIMFLLVVVLVLAGQVVRDVKPLSVTEKVAAAAAIATDGIAHGLSSERRTLALRYLDGARADGADPSTLDCLHELITSADDVPGYAGPARVLTATTLVGVFGRPRWVTVAAWVLLGMALLAWAGNVIELLAGSNPRVGRADSTTDSVSMSAIVLACIQGITVLSLVVALIARRRTDSDWPLRLLRYAAIFYGLFGAAMGFVIVEFGGLFVLVIGMAAYAIFSLQLRLQSTEE